MKPVRTQAQRRALSEQKLIEAAIALVGEKGFSQTTIDDVGQRAGYSRGLVSNRYGSKLGLGLAIFEHNRHVIGQFMRDQTAEVEGQYQILVQLCAGYFRAMAEAAVEMKALFVMMFEAIGPLPGLQSHYEELTKNLIAIFENLLIKARQANEVTGEFEPRDIAFTIVAQLRGVTLHWSTNAEQVNLTASFNELVKWLELRLQPVDLG